MMRVLVLLLCLLIAACASRPRAVVVERSTEPAVTRSTAPPRGRTAEYLVVRGDTLYGIAFRHGVDFRDLARWNRIPSPYTIYPGQRLKLGGDTRVSQAPPPRTTPAPATPIPRAPTPSTPIASKPPVATPAPVTTRPPPATPPAPTPVPPLKPPVPLAPSPVAGNPPEAPPSGVRNAEGVTWRWPASGQLISRYVAGDPTRQGVNIAGSSGQPVFAAAAGEVVYSGAGLIGYGELIIIKHSDTFLSAYGHNRKRLVSEGQRVTSGQQIAEMGRSGAARDMLHFEIRRSGKPIDPLPLLPKR
jgi:lipoprotein NlpD